MFESFFGKTLTDIKAFGVDEFDFTADLLGTGFSVGQFGYTVLEFGNECIFISTNGLSLTLPKRKNVSKLMIEEKIKKAFIGKVLTSIMYVENHYMIQFEGLEIIDGYLDINEGWCDRDYFELDFPWN